MELLSWGANSHGQLGQGIISEQCNPSDVTKTWNNSIKYICCGGGHTLLLDCEGQLYGCGWNQQKQLGFQSDLNNSKVHTFTRIWELSGLVFDHLCTGWDSSAGVTNKNVLYIWGSNAFGQLGLPKEHFPKYMKPIQLELRVKNISMGMRHTVLIDVNNNVWSTGQGKYGELGLGKEILTSDYFRKIPNICNIDVVKCGQQHTLAWSMGDKKLYSWGSNTYGQLNLAEKDKMVFSPTEVTFMKQYMNDVINIFCGWTHSAALLKDGSAIYWGRNDYGQLGSGYSDFFNIIKFQGKIIKELSVGSEHSACILDDGSVWSWGWNEHNNTGTGDKQNVLEPQLVLVGLCKPGSKIYSGAGNNYLVHHSEEMEVT